MPNGGDGWFSNLTESSLEAMNVGDTGTGVRFLRYSFDGAMLTILTGLRE